MWSTYVVPETGGVPLEDMDKVFNSAVGARDAGLRREVCTLFASFDTIFFSLSAD